MRVLLLLMIEILLLILVLLLLMLVLLLGSFSGILLLCSLCIFTCNSLCRLLGLGRGSKCSCGCRHLRRGGRRAPRFGAAFALVVTAVRSGAGSGGVEAGLAGVGVTLQQPRQALGR